MVGCCLFDWFGTDLGFNGASSFEGEEESSLGMTVELPEIAISSGQTMVLPAKPVLQRAKTEPKPHSAYTKAEKDHVQVIKSLCKTYKATLTKLTYVFASLHDECKESSKVSNISEALRASKRDEMMESISQSLAGGVEEILRSKDISLRAGVLRDLRARFVVAAPPAKVDGETQTVQPRERKPKPSKEQGDGGEEPAAPKPEAAASGSEKAATTQAFSGMPSKLTRAFSFADRQIQWEVKKLAKIQKEREEKEAREKAEAKRQRLETLEKIKKDNHARKHDENWSTTEGVQKGGKDINTFRGKYGEDKGG